MHFISLQFKAKQPLASVPSCFRDYLPAIGLTLPARSAPSLATLIMHHTYKHSYITALKLKSLLIMIHCLHTVASNTYDINGVMVQKSLHAYIHTCMHAYIRTYIICMYVHTYMGTYVLICI